MDDDNAYGELVSVFDSLPTAVIIDLSEPVRKIGSVFKPDPRNLIGPEYVIDRAIEACRVRTTAHRDIGLFSTRLLKDLRDLKERRNLSVQEFKRISGNEEGEWPYPSTDLMDMMVTIEQATLDIFDILQAYKMYVSNRYLPYRYETMMPDGTVILKRCQTLEEFLDLIAYP